MDRKPAYEELEQMVKELEKEVTDLKRLGGTLGSEKDKLQLVFDGLARAEIGVDIVGINYDVQFQNQILKERFGNLTGQLCYEKYMGLEEPCIFCPMIKAVRNNKVESVELTADDGRNYELILAPLPNPDGTVDKAIEVVKDITDRKQTEKALQESEKKYRTLLETTSEGWWLLNPEFKIIEVNQAICNMLGYSQDEILGKTPFDFADDENRKIFIEQSSKIPTIHHRNFEIILKKKNGEDLHTYFNASTIRDESGDIQGFFALITDITERKQAQEERDRLATAIEQAAESAFITDRDGIIQYVNPAFEHLTGYSRKDAIGQNPRILKSGKHDALFYKEMWDTLTRGDAWHGRFINKKKDGSFYEVDATISPVLDKSGKIINFVSIKRDVTHEVELEKRLIQSQKMEAIGTLAGGIAHDFNNILAAIMGYSELALIKVPKETRLYDNIQKVLNAGYRAKDLVKQILTFSRKTEEEKAPVQIRHLVKEALQFLRSSLPATIEIREEIAGDIGIVNPIFTTSFQ